MAKIFSKKDENPELEPEALENGQPQNPDPNAIDSQKLNAVRELLFGQTVENHQKEFQDVRDSIRQNKEALEDANKDLKNELFDRLDKLENQLKDKIEDTSKSLSDRIDQLSDSKADRKKIASILHNLASELEN